MPDSCRLGVVLSSGGGRGVYAHTGFLPTRERRGISICARAGGGAGAVVGGVALRAGRLWSAGHRPSPRARQPAFWTPDSLARFLWQTAVHRGGATPICRAPTRRSPFAAATSPCRLSRNAAIRSTPSPRASRGGKVLFSTDELAPFMRASVAMPVFYRPVEIGSNFSLATGRWWTSRRWTPSAAGTGSTLWSSVTWRSTTTSRAASSASCGARRPGRFRHLVRQGTRLAQPPAPGIERGPGRQFPPVEAREGFASVARQVKPASSRCREPGQVCFEVSNPGPRDICRTHAENLRRSLPHGAGAPQPEERERARAGDRQIDHAAPRRGGRHGERAWRADDNLAGIPRLTPSARFSPCARASFSGIAGQHSMHACQRAIAFRA